MNQQELIADVIEEVMKQIGPATPGPTVGGNAAPAVPSTPAAVTAYAPQYGSSGASPGGRPGIFNDVEQAVAAAERSQQQLAAATLEVRDGICKLLKKIVVEKKQEWGTFEMNETRIGRLDHKILKLELLAGIPGVEFLCSAAHSGDGGIAIDVHAGESGFKTNSDVAVATFVSA